jgi:hypothetical protein
MPANQPMIRRLCLAVDVESYSRRHRSEQLDIQTRLLWCMAHACRAAGIRPDQCARQDSGDGQLLLVPAALDEDRVISGLVTGLLTALHRANQSVGSGGRMRLRAALGQGAVQEGPTGYIGPAVVEVCRILDSDELRSALTAAPRADAAFAATADLFRDIFGQEIGGLPAQGFRSVQIIKTGKGFETQAWISVPDRIRWRDDIPAYTDSPDLAHWKRPRASALLDLSAAAALAWVVFGSARHGGPDPGHLRTPSHVGHEHGPAAHEPAAHEPAGHGPAGHGPAGHAAGSGHGSGAHADYSHLTDHDASLDVADLTAYSAEDSQADYVSGYDTPYDTPYGSPHGDTVAGFTDQSGDITPHHGSDDTPGDTHHHGADSSF